jgi:hypothetical protein
MRASTPLPIFDRLERTYDIYVREDEPFINRVSKDIMRMNRSATLKARATRYTEKWQAHAQHSELYMARGAAK